MAYRCSRILQRSTLSAFRSAISKPASSSVNGPATTPLTRSSLPSHSVSSPLRRCSISRYPNLLDLIPFCFVLSFGTEIGVLGHRWSWVVWRRCCRCIMRWLMQGWRRAWAHRLGIVGLFLRVLSAALLQISSMCVFSVLSFVFVLYCVCWLLLLFRLSGCHKFWLVVNCCSQ